MQNGILGRHPVPDVSPIQIFLENRYVNELTLRPRSRLSSKEGKKHAPVTRVRNAFLKFGLQKNLLHSLSRRHVIMSVSKR